MSRFISFVYGCFHSHNPIVRIAVDLAKYSSTTVARNIRIVLSYLNVDLHFLKTVQPARVKDILRRAYYNCVSDLTVAYGQVISELCNVRDSYATCPLDVNEMREIIESLCIASDDR